MNHSGTPISAWNHRVQEQISAQLHANRCEGMSIAPMKQLAFQEIVSEADKQKHNKQKATNEEIRESYKRTGSVWKTGDELGMRGQKVHERLVRLGVMESPKITEQERVMIREAYERGFKAGDGVLEQLSVITGRTRQLICREAGKMGLTSNSRPSNERVCKATGDRARERIRLKGHPRGMAGKKHTQETKDLISRVTTGRIIPPEQTLRSMKARLEKHGPQKQPHGSWKSAWREIGGRRIYARSRWEANYARYLEFLRKAGQLVAWEHEPKTFWFEEVQRGCRSYLPDFLVTYADGHEEYHEVKGWMDDRSKTKIARMAKYFPDVVLVVRDAKWFRDNQRNLRGIIPEWEHWK